MALKLSALRAGRHLLSGGFLVLISVSGWVDRRAIVRLEGLGQLKKSSSSDSNPRPSGLQHSASTNYSTAWPQCVTYDNIYRHTKWRKAYPCSHSYLSIRPTDKISSAANKSQVLSQRFLNTTTDLRFGLRSPRMWCFLVLILKNQRKFMG
jgi:hypothetical protein